MKRCVIYCRVSSARQVAEGNGLDSQEVHCRSYAERMDYKVIGVFKEKGVTGGLFEREAMKKLLSFLEENDSNNPEDKIVVVFDDLKRFARDVPVHFKLKEEIYGRNAIIESPNFKFEDTPEGKFVETIISATGALEKDQNRRQVLQKMRARLEAGYWAFAPSTAFKNKKDPIRGRILTAVEPHASIFKRALERYADGILSTQQEVRDYLHREYKAIGMPNRFSLSTTAMILKNPLHAGYLEYEPWGIPFAKAKHDGFITLETYQKVLDRLHGRSKPWRRKDHSVDFPLRPHVECSVCNTPLSGSWNKGRSKYYANYFCRHKDCKYKWKTTRNHVLEAKFELLLQEVKLFDQDIELTKDILNEQWHIRFEQYSEHRIGMSNEIKESEKAIRSYLDLVRATKDVDLKLMYEQELKESIRRKKAAEQELTKKVYTSEQFGTAVEKVLNTLKEPMSMWKSDNYNDRRMVLFMYFEDKLKYDYAEGFGTANLAYPVKLISDLGQAKNGNVEMSGSEPESE